MRTASPEAYLTLLSAGTTARRERLRERALELSACVNWEVLTGMLVARRLLVQLGPRIVELVGDRAPASFVQAIDGAVGDARRHGAFLQLVGMRLTQLLGEAGIVSMTLKGPSLAEAIYGDPGRRVANDIDLLLLAEDLPRAIEVARENGYEAPDDYVDEHGLPLLHHALVHGRNQLPMLELHWRVHWYERDFSRQALLRSVERDQGQRGARLCDELVCLLLFYARDGFFDLRLGADIAAWWDRFGSDLERGALDEAIACHPALQPALLAAVKAAEHVVGLPSEELLLRPYRQRRRTSIATRLANPNPRLGATQAYADMGLVDWLLTPPGGQRELIRRQLLVPRQVRAQRAVRAGERRTMSALGHCGRVLVRYGFAIVRAIRGPELQAPGARA